MSGSYRSAATTGANTMPAGDLEIAAAFALPLQRSAEAAKPASHISSPELRV